MQQAENNEQGNKHSSNPGDAISINNHQQNNNISQSNTEKQVNKKSQEENGTCFSTLSNSVIIELRDIVENIEPFQQNGVSFDVMSGKDISAVLQLETIPDLKKPEHKNLLQHQIR